MKILVTIGAYVKDQYRSKPKIRTLRLCRYFSDFGDEILTEISAGMQLYRYEAGEGIFWEGETARRLHIIESGSVTIYKISHQGRELVLNGLGEGETFNEVAVFDGKDNPANVAAIEETTIWIV